MCPDCKEPLITLELEGVEIDHCLACKGTWLDAGELVMLTEQVRVETDELADALARAWKGPRSERRCPRCRRHLRLIQLGREETVIELDRCPVRHGLWLDPGEMMAVITAFAPRKEGKIARFFADLYRSELESAG
jgi:Zn-finger nucleic acid-binding protein